MTKRDQLRQILLTIHEEAGDLEALSSEMQAALDRAITDTKAVNKAA